MWSGNLRPPQHSQDEWQSYSAKTSSRKSGALTNTELVRLINSMFDFHTDDVFKVTLKILKESFKCEHTLSQIEMQMRRVVEVQENQDSQV